MASKNNPRQRPPNRLTSAEICLLKDSLSDSVPDKHLVGIAEFCDQFVTMRGSDWHELRHTDRQINGVMLDVIAAVSQ